MKSYLKIMIAMAVAVLMTAHAYGEDIEFTFDIPTIPDPPVIESVTNSTAVEQAPFTVYATIKGTEQKEVCCKGTCTSSCAPPDQPSNCDWENCEMTDFYGQADTRVNPNPTCIPSSLDTSGGTYPSDCGGKSGNPRLFYYYNGDPTSGSSVDMTYNSDIGSFTAEISTGALIEGDVVAYYIIASDNRGNVISQVPDPDIAPCTTLTSWDSNYETPAIANCAMMNSYERCGGFKTGNPSCGSTYSQNDPENDTCDENQNVDASLDLDDVIGISGGAGKGFQSLPTDVVLCAKIKLGANPPDVGSSSGPIDAYVMIFFNPDIPDDNPSDVWMKNATAITYAPEASGADPNLVKVLWDGECVTNPNTADPLACKLIVGGTEVNELKIGAANAALTFIAKNALPNGQTMLGSTQGITKAAIATGNIQLDGGTPFWLTDLTAGYAIMRQNQEVTIGPAEAPAPPIVPSPADCVNAAGTHEEQCTQSASEPSSNDCYLTIFKSPDCAFTDQYKVYHNTTNNVSSASALGTIDTNEDCANKDYSHEITELDGKIHYYWVSSINADGPYETDQNKWATTKCTVEDWVEPDPPTDFTCATPTSQEKKCECTWSADTITDPSITGFYLMRDDTDLTADGPRPAGGGTTEYSYTDTAEALVLGQPFTYKITTEDAGSNLSTEETTSCTPEDLAAPGRVDSLVVTLKSGNLAVNFSWAPGTEDDLAGYNAYRCLNTIPGASCIYSEQFTKLNTSGLITHVPGDNLTLEDSDYDTPDEDWCYWVEACDNCDAQSNCPSTGVPNCSTFNTLKTYTKCIMVTQAPDPYYPKFPVPYGGDPLSYIDPDNTDRNILMTEPDAGSKCELDWHKVCEDDELVFPDCNFPEADRIVGYYIMRAEAPTGNCADITLDTNPVLDSMGHLAGTEVHGAGSPSFSDTGLTNGTTYCYRVHAYDSANNFSNQEPMPDPIPCVPMDVIPPDDPELAATTESEFICTPAWAEVDDPDTVTYNLYRCDDSPENCTSEGSYSAIVSSSLNLTESDVTVMFDNAYTYCTTAVDGSANESDLFASTTPAISTNCTPCRTVEPATAVSASANGTGFDVNWTDSASSLTISGYNVYACDSTGITDPDTELRDPANNSACTEEAALVAAGGSYNQAACSVTNGDYYIAVSAESDTGTESGPAYISAAITLACGAVACPNGTCGPDEDTQTCAADCTSCASITDETDCDGDTSCQWNVSVCEDYVAVTCPDGTCGTGENTTSCSADCTSCSLVLVEDDCTSDAACDWSGSACIPTVCDTSGTCDTGEHTTNCSADCTSCALVLVEADCGTDPACQWNVDVCEIIPVTDDPVCGDEVCDNGETCVLDCDTCGNDYCGPTEDKVSCAADCDICDPADTCCLDPEDSSCTITITLSGTFKTFDIVPCDGTDTATTCPTGEFRKRSLGEKAMAGLEIALVDPDDYTVITTTMTNESGKVPDGLTVNPSDVTLGEKYRIAAKYPASTFGADATKQCLNEATVATDEYCLVDLTPNKLKIETASDAKSVSAKSMAVSTKAYGTLIGDPSGDGAVGFPDLNILKQGFNAGIGQPCYEPWADFDQDGIIGFPDLNILKQNFNKNFATVDMQNLDTDNYAPSVEKGSDDFTQDCLDSK